MNNTKKRKRNRQILRVLGKITIGLLLLLVFILLFIRSQWGQSIIKDRLVNYLTDKTRSEITLDKLYISFSGNIVLEGLYVEDTHGDTLVYSRSLEADMPIWPIIRGKGIGVDALAWEGLRANITRKDTLNGYNFQFLIDAFAPEDATPAPKDSVSEPLNLILGNIDLIDMNVVFNDAVLGIDSRFIIGNLTVDMEKTDLENMDFRADDIRLANSRIKFHQKPAPPSPEDDATALPYLAIDEITLKNVFADYRSEPGEMAAIINIDRFYSEIPKIDLKNESYQVEVLRLNNSSIAFHQKAKSIDDKDIKKSKEPTSSESFDWPDIAVQIENIDSENNTIQYTVGNAQPRQGTLNPDALAISGLSFKANDLFLENKKAGINIDLLKFKDTSGVNLKKLAFQLSLTDHNLSLNQLALAMNNNTLDGQLALSYSSLNSLMETPEKSEINLQIPDFYIALGDLFPILPALKENPYLVALRKNPVTGGINASGSLASVDLKNTKLQWHDSNLTATGSLHNITTPRKLVFNFPTIKAASSSADLSKFIDEKELGISLPETFTLTARASGALDNFTADAQLNTTAGAITAKGSFNNQGKIAFDADIKVEELELNKILNDSVLGNVNLIITATGSGSNINTLDGKMKIHVLQAGLKNYNVKNLVINGHFKNGEGNITSKYKDEHLNLILVSDLTLDSINPKATVQLDLIGADLQALGLMERNIKTGLKLETTYVGDSAGFDIGGTVKDGVVVYDNKTYLLGGLNFEAHIRKDTTAAEINSRVVNLKLASNTDPETFVQALERHIKSYFYRDEIMRDSTVNPVNIKLYAKISQAPVLNEVFLVNLKDLGTVNINMDFNEKVRKLAAKVTAPRINYSGNTIDSLAFTIDTNREAFDFNLGFAAINVGPFSVPKTQIQGEQREHNLHLDFLAFDQKEVLTEIHSTISGHRDSLRFQVRPEDLVFNKSDWSVPTKNAVFIMPDKIAFDRFIFSKNNQSITFTDKLNDVPNDHIALEFKNFKLTEILGYLNPDENLASGNVNGTLVVENPFKNTGISAALNIADLHVLNEDLGTLKLDADQIKQNQYDYELAVKGGEIILGLTGDYRTGEETAINAELAIDKFKMSALEGFTQSGITDGKGSFSGNFTISGDPSGPSYKGSLIFSDAYIKVKKLNAGFTLANEELDIDNSGVYMADFTILDENKNTIVFDGNIGTKSYLNPTFNLDVIADNFRFINATKEDNETLYGKGNFNAKAKLTGNLRLPKINIDATINKNTDLTYVLPTATVNIEKRDGIVIFVNRENPDAILTQTEAQTATITGFDIKALLKIDEEAAFTIVLDEETQDNFKVSGKGDLNFTMNPNGRMILTGIYDVADGHYEMSLYNLVKRKFIIAPDSRVRWSGDPFNAELDIRAEYAIETSASPLMASQTSGADPSVKNKFRQELPFFVYLNIDGELMQPKITFSLDMPEDQKGAIGGQVYGRLQQVNQQEGELNRQVFSLLVLNKFYPEPGSDGSGGGFAAVARDNLNDAISDQLNVFSNKLLKDTGFELNFGLDSYTDYQGDSPQERTQLEVAAKQRLFDDRLIVSVGSEVDIDGQSSDREAAPIIGNVSIEYLLTENGRYRLKGFRRNEYENVIDGQTIISGIALIFTQEFNKFNELWETMFRSSDQ